MSKQYIDEMACEIDLWLPFPPTVNNYYVKTNRGMFISAKGKKFRKEVLDSINEQCPGLKLSGRFMVQVVLFPGDKRVRDVDNYNKGLLDAITHSGVWKDDGYIDQLFDYRGEVLTRHTSKCFVKISPAGPIIKQEHVNML